MADNGSSGMGAIAGVIIGAVLVVGAIFFFTSNNWHGGGGGGSKVTINAPSAPAAPGK